MTAKEKFEARLNFLGLADEWSAIGGTGKVGTFDPYGGIIVLIHDGWEDGYSEIRYPSYNSLRKNDAFVDACAHKCVTLDNELDFATKTARWLLHITDECPLEAVDVYSVCESEFNEYYEDFEDDPEVIMTTLQNHNPALVAQINEKWGRFKERFKPVLCALYERDIDEITSHDAWCMPEWEDWDEYKHGLNTGEWSTYNQKALAEMQKRWAEFAHSYLMHIADDQDLETILTFVRFDVCEETGREKIFRNGTGVVPRCLDGSPWERCNSYEELEAYLGKDAMTEEDERRIKWWLVGRFTDGNLWMNNQEGCCYLESNTNLNIYYARWF